MKTIGKRAYKNMLDFFKLCKCTLDYTINEINNTGNVQYTCKNNHTNKLTVNSYGNKKCHLENEKEKNPDFDIEMCAECAKNIQRELDMMEYNNLLKERESNHRIVKYIDSKNLSYICGGCGNIVDHTTWGNLDRPTSNKEPDKCGSCAQIYNRKNYDELKREVESYGFALVTASYEYTNNKDILVECFCGSIWKTALHDMKRGRKCNMCADDRRNATMDDKFGEKIIYKDKEWTVLGFEPFGLKNLLEVELVDYKNILAGHTQINPIKYTINNKDYKYYPDILIPSHNRLIEVKSTWTYHGQTNLTKQKLLTGVRKGYNTELWMINKYGKIIKIPIIDEDSFNFIIPENFNKKSYE